MIERINNEGLVEFGLEGADELIRNSFMDAIATRQADDALGWFMQAFEERSQHSWLPESSQEVGDEGLINAVKTAFVGYRVHKFSELPVLDPTRLWDRARDPKVPLDLTSQARLVYAVARASEDSDVISQFSSALAFGKVDFKETELKLHVLSSLLQYVINKDTDTQTYREAS